MQTTPGLARADIEGATPAATPAAGPAAPAAGTVPSGTPAAGTPAAAMKPNAGMIRLQILLDRSAFSPGQIDGLHGENTRQAIEAYREANNLGTGDVPDAALLQSLTATDAGPVTQDYVLTTADVSGPFSPPPTEDLKAQAAAGTNYSTALERIAERFHVSEALLQTLNPGVNFQSAGARILVPALNMTPLASVARIEVDKSAKAIRAYDASDKMIAFYPATIGSGDNPSPSGEVKINGVARAPDYTYDPAKLSYGPGGDKVIVPAGANNPVGAVWIDLDRPSYGIHGTPDPTKIGKSASHGCVRLTNWDAQQLAAAVKPGVMVRFV
jgi:lipoprotein-anchoring transpeptidase ErfK/SrfK